MPDNSELLSQLHDIQLPDPVGWWPLAFTSWIFILTVTSILVGMAWYYFEQKRRNAYRATALKELDKIIDQQTLYDNQKIAQINRLLKQVALTAYGRQKISALHDDAWLKFLFETTSYINQPENLREILALGYQSPHAFLDESDEKPAITTSKALDVWQVYAKQWIKGHHQ